MESKLLPILISMALLSLLVPVKAQDLYYTPPATVYRDSDAYVPGFQLRVIFSYTSGAAIVASLTRTNNFTEEPTTRYAGGFNEALFITDSVNEYTFNVSSTYIVPVNQSIRIVRTSGGVQVQDMTIWVLASIVRLSFEVLTVRQPQYPTAEDLAAAQGAVNCSQYQWCKDLLDNFESNQTANDQNMTNLYVINGVALAVVIGLVGMHLRQRY